MLKRNLIIVSVLIVNMCCAELGEAEPVEIVKIVEEDGEIDITKTKFTPRDYTRYGEQKDLNIRAGFDAAAKIVSKYPKWSGLYPDYSKSLPLIKQLVDKIEQEFIEDTTKYNILSILDGIIQYCDGFTNSFHSFPTNQLVAEIKAEAQYWRSWQPKRHFSSQIAITHNVLTVTLNAESINSISTITESEKADYNLKKLCNKILEVNSAQIRSVVLRINEIDKPADNLPYKLTQLSDLFALEELGEQEFSLELSLSQFFDKKQIQSYFNKYMQILSTNETLQKLIHKTYIWFCLLSAHDTIERKGFENTIYHTFKYRYFCTLPLSSEIAEIKIENWIDELRNNNPDTDIDTKLIKQTFMDLMEFIRGYYTANSAKILRNLQDELDKVLKQIDPTSTENIKHEKMRQVIEEIANSIQRTN